MSDSENSPEVFEKATFNALAKKLSEYDGPLGEMETKLLNVFIHMLTDPIERLKLHQMEGQFNDDEEAVVEGLEKGEG
jgi:hypothetical protein